MKHAYFRLTLTKVSQLLYQGDAISVQLPGEDGEFTVLAHHEPLVSLLKKGTITIKGNEDYKTFNIDNGVCEVHNNSVTILV